jgi:hypothetical protein
MILKNKTNGMQTLNLNDGSRASVRPYRTITLDEKLLVEAPPTDVWDYERVEKKEEKKAKVVESTSKGK